MKTPIAGDALVTVERDRVLRSFVTRLSGNSPSIQVPVAETDAPNVFVSVMLLRGANDSPRKIKAPEYRIGYCELRVARPNDKLAVTVKPSNPVSKPGEKIALEAEVRDASGKPAADSEVVLFAVDEGVLSLTGYKTPDPLTFFNQRRRLDVQTSLTLPTLLKEDAEESDFANKGYLIGDGKGGPSLLDGLRKNFLACAFWNATLRTDAQGRVRAEFVAPDSLTRYRVIAIAASKQNQFGTGESAVEINKPIMLEASLPRFGNLGDKLVLRAVLHNTTDLAGEADVELQLDATAKAAEAKRHVTLPAHGSVPIDFPAELVATGHAQWRWSVRFVGTGQKTELQDALQSELEVGYPAPLLREVQTKRIESNDAELARISDPQIMEGSGQVDVNVANTRVIELRESLRQLLHYPYGCVEQATSSLLPWLLVRDLRGDRARTREERCRDRRGREQRRQLASLDADKFGRAELLAGRPRTDVVGQRLRRARAGPRAKTKVSRAGGGGKEGLQLSQRTTSRHGERRHRLRTLGSLSRRLHPRDRWANRNLLTTICCFKSARN